MKVVVQRVTSAKVTVGESLVSSIGRGLCVLVGISRDDTQKDIDYMDTHTSYLDFNMPQSFGNVCGFAANKPFKTICILADELNLFLCGVFSLIQLVNDDWSFSLCLGLREQIFQIYDVTLQPREQESARGGENKPTLIASVYLLEKACALRVRKILNVRYFEDESGKRWSRCVKDKKFEILCVSQFTLCHKLKGNKLDFHCAMAPTESEAFYNKFLEYLKKSYEPDLIKDGKFGEYMQVDIVNDGPVTIHLESPSSPDSDSSQALGASDKPTENSDGN